MRIVFRCDSGAIIGGGHVMRCLTLANVLKRHFNATVSFICRQHEGHINHIISNQGFELFSLLGQSSSSFSESDYSSWLGVSLDDEVNNCKYILDSIEHVDWLVVDHYSLDIVWQKALSDTYRRCFVIDDLANRKHFCDILLDQTYGINIERYESLVNNTSKLLLGTQYALLREQFTVDKASIIKRRNSEQHVVRNVLVSMGATDPDNLTVDVLDALKAISDSIEITVVLSSKAPFLSQVSEKVREMESAVLQIDVENMADIILHADIAFGSGGTSAWERCALGLPTILITCAGNQYEIAKQLHAANAVVNLGYMKSINTFRYVEAVLALQNKTTYDAMVMACLAICNGDGAYRVAKIIAEDDLIR